MLRKTVILVFKFLFRIQILFALYTHLLVLVHTSMVFKIFLLIFLFMYFY